MKNVLGIFILKGLAGLSALIFNVILAKKLSTIHYASYNFIFSQLILAGGIALCGLNLYSVKTIPSLGKELIKNLIGLNLGIVSFSSLIISSTLIILNLNNWDTSKILFYLSLIPYSLLQIISFTNQGLKKHFKSELFNKVTWNILGISSVIILFPKSITETELSFVFFGVSFFLLILALLNLKPTANFSSLTWGESKKVLSLSKNLYLSNTLGILTPNLPILICGYLSIQGVAYLAPAFKINTVLGLILTSINTYYKPFIAELGSDNKLKELKEMYIKIQLVTTIAGLMLFLLILIYGKEILGLFGNAYIINSSLPLKIISFQFLVNIALGPCGSFLNMLNREKYETLSIVLFVSTFGISVIMTQDLFRTEVSIAFSALIATIVQNLSRFYQVHMLLRFKMIDYLNTCIYLKH